MCIQPPSLLTVVQLVAAVGVACGADGGSTLSSSTISALITRPISMSARVIFISVVFITTWSSLYCDWFGIRVVLFFYTPRLKWEYWLSIILGIRRGQGRIAWWSDTNFRRPWPTRTLGPNTTQNLTTRPTYCHGLRGRSGLIQYKTLPHDQVIAMAVARTVAIIFLFEYIK